MKSGLTDQSGIRLMLTPVLRPTELGMFTNGAASSWAAILIPPKQQSFSLSFYCHNNCLNVRIIF